MPWTSCDDDVQLSPSSQDGGTPAAVDDGDNDDRSSFSSDDVGWLLPSFLSSSVVCG